MKGILLLGFAWSTLVYVYAGDTNATFRAFEVSDQPPIPVPASKASVITNGITLGQIVATLGPGWMTAHMQKSSVAPHIMWRFSDGRVLHLCPESWTADEVIATNSTSSFHHRPFYWFETASTNTLSESRK